MLPIFKDDPALIPHEGHIMQRIRDYRKLKQELNKNEGGLENFASGYKMFGFQRDDVNQQWTYTEWLPAAKQAF